MDGRIVAVVSTDRNLVAGGAPIFFTADEGEKERMALYLSRICRAMAHRLPNGCLILVKH